MQPILPALSNNLMIYISFVLCLATAVIIPTFIIPLQIKQAGRVNGLAKLRKQMLRTGIVTEVTAIVATYFLGLMSLRLLSSEVVISTTTQLMLVLFSFSKFVNAVTTSQIYHQQYVLEHKEEHAKK